MTNYQKWRAYTDGLVSPDNFIDFGFYYLIAASLQRRVWVGPKHAKLFANNYTILVAEPGVGKGLVVKQVSEFLKHHKLPEPNQNSNSNATNETDRVIATTVAKEDYEAAEKQSSRGGKKDGEKPLLIPIASDATTYEALVRAMARSIRRINFREPNPFNGQEQMSIYTHSSLCFSLEEISSLFRKRTEDTVHMLLQAYDCGDYEYDTKTQGKDKIKKCCLNFFGGTTPGFLHQIFNDQLISEGFSSRTFFIFATKNRKSCIFIPELTLEQEQYKRDILAHIEKLTRLYGKVHVDQSTIDWLEKWWADSQEKRANSSYKLNPYYSRKNIHVLKLALAMHFGESTEMSLEKPEIERAIERLSKEELNMHFALGFDNGNPLASLSRKVYKHLTSAGRKTRTDLIAEFWELFPRGDASDIDTVLEHLISIGNIEQLTEPNPKIENNSLIYYSARSLEQPVI